MKVVQSALVVLATAFLSNAPAVVAQIPSGYVQTTATVPSLANGSFGASWTNLSSSHQLGLLGCVSTFQQTVSGRFDANGRFSVLLADTTQICPSPSTWAFTLTFACPAGQPASAFIVQVPITGGGGTEDISSQITAALPTSACGGGSIIPAVCINDVLWHDTAHGGTDFGDAAHYIFDVLYANQPVVVNDCYAHFQQMPRLAYTSWTQTGGQKLFANGGIWQLQNTGAGGAWSTTPNRISLTGSTIKVRPITTVTNSAIASGTVTLTLTNPATNGYASGDVISSASFTNASCLNGKYVQLSSANSTTLVGTIIYPVGATCTDVGSAAEGTGAVVGGSYSVAVSSTTGVVAGSPIGPGGMGLKAATNVQAVIDSTHLLVDFQPQAQFQGYGDGNSYVLAPSDARNIASGQTLKCGLTGQFYNGTTTGVDQTNWRVNTSGTVTASSPQLFTCNVYGTITETVYVQPKTYLVTLGYNSTASQNFQNQMIDAGLYDMTIQDPGCETGGINGGCPTGGQTLYGAGGIKMVGHDHLHLSNIEVRGLLGTGISKGGYVTPNLPFGGPTREMAFVDVRLGEDGEPYSGQPAFENVGGYCDSNVCDLPNTEDYYGLHIVFPNGPGMVFGSHSPRYELTSQGPRLQHFIGGQVEGGAVNPNATPLYDLIDIYESTGEMDFSSMHINSPGYGKALINVSKASGGITINQGSMRPIAQEATYTVSTTDGLTFTFVSGPTGVTRFPDFVSTMNMAGFQVADSACSGVCYFHATAETSNGLTITGSGPTATTSGTKQLILGAGGYGVVLADSQPGVVDINPSLVYTQDGFSEKVLGIYDLLNPVVLNPFVYMQVGSGFIGNIPCTYHIRMGTQESWPCTNNISWRTGNPIMRLFQAPNTTVGSAADTEVCTAYADGGGTTDANNCSGIGHINVGGNGVSTNLASWFYVNLTGGVSTRGNLLTGDSSFNVHLNHNFICDNGGATGCAFYLTGGTPGYGTSGQVATSGGTGAPVSWKSLPTAIQFLMISGPSTTAAAGTNYNTPNGAFGIGASQANRQLVLSRSGTIANLKVCTVTAQPNDGALVVTYETGPYNGSITDQALTITIPTSGIGQCYTDSTHSFSYTAGNALIVKFANASASASAAMTSVTAELQNAQ